MNLIRTTKQLMLALSSLLFFASCVISSSKPKEPAFRITTDSLVAQLNKLVVGGTIRVEGRELTSNGKKTTELELDITNSNNIPKDENQKTALGRKIALLLKNALVDKNEYESYQIVYITEKGNSSIMQSSSNSKVFKSEDL